MAETKRVLLLDEPNVHERFNRDGDNGLYYAGDVSGYYTSLPFYLRKGKIQDGGTFAPKDQPAREQAALRKAKQRYFENTVAIYTKDGVKTVVKELKEDFNEDVKKLNIKITELNEEIKNLKQTQRHGEEERRNIRNNLDNHYHELKPRKVIYPDEEE